jgi:UDP-2,4-diacetamido-2,4,6-trideoxy-beta-L-altropyranose hydrolase
MDNQPPAPLPLLGKECDMKILIRADSSSTIGGGHLMRCLSLAERLRRDGAAVILAARDLPGSQGEMVEERHFELVRVGDGPEVEEMKKVFDATGRVNWMIVDHYGYNDQTESPLRSYSDHIMVIDDLANRRHDCDLLLDQNLYPDAETRYKDLVPASCRKLFGPNYALLRHEFPAAHENLRHRDGIIRHLLITMGGADPRDITSTVLQAIELLDWPELTMDIVIGPSNPRFDKIRRICPPPPRARIHHPAKDMAALMAKADLCIGTAGSTTWERCCLGLPTIFIASGDCEAPIAQAADTAGIGKYIGRYNEVWPEMIAGELENLKKRPELILNWSRKASKLVDGRGVKRVCREIYIIRPAEVLS